MLSRETDEVFSELSVLFTGQVRQYSAEVLLVYLAEPRSFIQQRDFRLEVWNGVQRAGSDVLHRMLYIGAVAERPDTMLDLVQQKLESPWRGRILSRPSAVNLSIKALSRLPGLEDNRIAGPRDRILKIPSPKKLLRGHLVLSCDRYVRVEMRP